MKKAIFIYDYTGIIAKPWLDAGYECWSFDGQHENGVAKEGNHYKVGMWFDAYKTEEQAEEIRNIVGPDVVHVFGFPECTHLAVSGAAHFKKKLEENPNIQWEATRLAILVQQVADLYKCPWGQKIL